MPDTKKAAPYGGAAAYLSDFRNNDTTAPASVEKLLERLEGVRRVGDGKWLARCPAHSDRSPSLSIRAVDDRVLVYDFGGCGTEDVLAAVGLEMADLFPECDGRRLDATRRSPVPRFRAAELVDLAAFEAQVVALAAIDVARGLCLTGDDIARVALAANTLAAVVREVGR